MDDSAMMELLGRYLAGECTPAESAMVVAWAAEAPENQKTLDALRAIWTQAPTPDPAAQARVDSAWERVRSRMAAPAPEQQAPAQAPAEALRPAPARRTWWRVAAMIAVALSISLVFYRVLTRPNALADIHVLAAAEQPVTDTLPDGTIVHLNAHSRLEYPAQFADGERVVSMDGEGFFEVAHDAAHPFRIRAGAGDVRVLGTSFNLLARGQQVRVAVATGRVELSPRAEADAPAGEKLLLTAGMTGSYDARQRKLVQEAGEVENDQYWRTGKLVFRDAPMQRVVEQLNAVFQDSIALTNPALAHCHLTTSFTKPSIDTVITVIAETFELQVTHNGNIYQLDGAGCQ